MKRRKKTITDFGYGYHDELLILDPSRNFFKFYKRAFLMLDMDINTEGLDFKVNHEAKSLKISVSRKSHLNFTPNSNREEYSFMSKPLMSHILEGLQLDSSKDYILQLNRIGDREFKCRVVDAIDYE